MPNSLLDLWRKNLQDAGAPDDRDDYSLMQDELIPLAKQNPALLTQYPDFADEVYKIRDANAGPVAGDFGRGLKAGTEELGATAAGVGALLDIPGAADESKKLEAEAAESAPTIPSYSDIHSAKDAARYVASKAGSFIPSIAEMVGLSAAGAAAGSAVEPGLGTLAGAGEGAVEGLLERGPIKAAIKAVVDSSVDKTLTEQAVKDAILAGDQKTADLVTKVAKNIVGGRAGEATNIANLYGQSVGGIYNETGDRKTALGIGALGAAAGALPGISLPSRVVRSLFPKLSADAAEKAAQELVATNAQKILSKLSKFAGATAGGTAGMVGMEAANIAAKNITQGKDATDLDDSDWKRLREAAVGGALASAPFAALTLRSPEAPPVVTPAAAATPDVTPEADAAEAASPVPPLAPPAAPPPSTPTLDLMRRVNAYSPDEARARLSELANNNQRSPTDEKEYQILRATARSADLPAASPAIETPEAPPVATAVDIGPRDETVSTGNGVETPKETDMMAKWKADVAAQASSDVPTFKEAGFESQEAFDAEYAKSHLAEHYESRDEFLRRVYCMGQAA